MKPFSCGNLKRVCQPVVPNLRVCCLAALLAALAIFCCPARGTHRAPSQQDNVDRLAAVTALAWSPDAAWLLVGSQSSVRAAATDGRASSLDTALAHVNEIAFSPLGQWCAVAGGAPAVSGEVEIWSWPDRQLRKQLQGHTDVVYRVAWHPQTEWIATASGDHTIRIWDVQRAECLKTIEGHSAPVLALAVSPDGKWLCSAGVDQTIRVWNTVDWTLHRRLNNHLGTVHALSFRPQTEEHPQLCLASASDDGTVRSWYPEIGRMVRIAQLRVPSYCLAWEPGGQSLWVGGKDGIIRQLDGDRLAVQKQLDSHADWIISMVLSPDGQQITIGSATGVRASFQR